MGLEAAILGAGALGLGGTLLGSKSQSKAASKAAGTQAQAANYAADVQRDMFETAYQGQMPYRHLGYQAAPLLSYFLTGQMPKLTPGERWEMEQIQRMHIPNRSTSDRTRLAELLAKSQAKRPSLETSPLYKMQLDEGTGAINRGFAARGLYRSSGATNALSDFARALGAEEMQRQYGRVLDALNVGRGAATESGGAAMNSGNALASIYQNAGSNQANYQMAEGQNRASMYGQLAALPMQLGGLYAMGGGFGGGGGGGGQWYGQGNPFTIGP